MSNYWLFHFVLQNTIQNFVLQNTIQNVQNEKANSTLRASRAVPHPSTDRALRRLTSEVRRDPVHSTRYGRQRKQCVCILHNAGGPSKHASTVLRNLDAVLCCVAVCYHKYMDA